ncbi:MAG TPA: hypothetical protein VGB24_23485 [Longimicrobium sp.]|jgi:hypothetical protein|uniref:hypothetical protein n=1 Tax=Longimicrobium sp. TaxID=2029185 RepID=UPI002ED8C914
MEPTLNAPAEPLRPVPSPGIVAREALHTVGQSVRLEIGAVLLLLLVVMAVVAPREPGGADYSVAEMTWPVVILSLFAPLAVWKHEEPSRRAYLWSLPVDRARHTLVRVWSGWAWLMALVAIYVVWAMAVAVVSGGNIVINEEWETMLLRELPPGSRIRDLTLAGHPWVWLTPFAGATTMYLAGTIVALLSNYPLRVFAGAWFGVMVVMGMADASGGVMDQVVERVGSQVILGRYGLLTHSTGVMGHGQGNLADQVNAGAWAVATLLWMALALAGVFLAARRYQER